MNWDRLIDVGLLIAIFAVYAAGLRALFVSSKPIDFSQLTAEEADALIAAARRTYNTAAYKMAPLGSALAKLDAER